MNESTSAASVPETDKKTQKKEAARRRREEDHKLVEQIRNGDPEAFRVLFEKYHRRVFAVAVGVVKNKEDALDVVQDAFIKAHKHIHTFQGTSSFYTWLYRIAMNLSIDHIRRTKRRPNTHYDDGIARLDDRVRDESPLLPRMLDGNPSRTVLRHELSKEIQAALDTLPEHHRAVLLLREVDGASYEQMSEVLEVPKGTIMSRLFHARRKMQEHLQDYVTGELEIK